MRRVRTRVGQPTCQLMVRLLIASAVGGLWHIKRVHDVLFRGVVGGWMRRCKHPCPARRDPPTCQRSTLPPWTVSSGSYHYPFASLCPGWHAAPRACTARWCSASWRCPRCCCCPSRHTPRSTSGEQGVHEWGLRLGRCRWRDAWGQRVPGVWADGPPIGRSGSGGLAKVGWRGARQMPSSVVRTCFL